MIRCDVNDDAGIDAAFAELGTHWDRLDFLVHAIAFSDRAELTGEYVHTSRGHFQRTMDVSCYSLTAVCQRAMKLMSGGGGVVTQIGRAPCRESVCPYASIWVGAGTVKQK